MANTLNAAQQFLYGGYRLTTQMNAYADMFGIEALNATTFGNTGRTKQWAPGMKTFVASFDGFYDATLDAGLFDLQAISSVPLTECLTDGTAGSPCRTVVCAIGEHKIVEAPVGQLATMRVGVMTQGRPVRGMILHNGAASGNITGGTAVQLGAIGATDTLVAALHVFDGDGNFTVKIQSDDNSGFTSATDRITFTQVGTATALSYEVKTLAGAITDTYWRIVATNPNTRDFAVSAAIMPLY